MLALHMLLVVSAVCAVPNDVWNGYHPGRSGDVILREHTSKGFVVVLGAKGEGAIIGQTQIADLLTHVSSSVVLPTSSNVHSRAGYPTVDVFSPPGATLFITVPGVAQEELAALDGATFEVRRESFPSEAAADLTTALTARFPSEHGITGASWMDDGKRVDAFSSPSTGRLESSIVDLWARADDSALVLSAAVQPAVAAAGGVAANVRASNAVVISWDEEGQAMACKAAGLKVALSDVRSVDGLSVDNAANAKFLIEYTFFAELARLLESSPSLRSMVLDNSADLFSLTYSSIEELKREHGATSGAVRTALGMVSQQLEDLRASFQNLYPRLATVVYYTGRSGEVSLATAGKIADALQTVEGVEAPSPEHATNVLFLGGGRVLDSACAKIMAVVASSVEVNCMVPKLFVRGDQFEVLVSVTNVTNTTYDTSEAAMFQATLWGAVVVLFFFYLGACGVFYMHNPEDPLLYQPGKTY